MPGFAEVGRPSDIIDVFACRLIAILHDGVTHELPTGLCKPNSSWSNRTHVKRPKNRWVHAWLGIEQYCKRSLLLHLCNYVDILLPAFASIIDL